LCPLSLRLSLSKGEAGPRFRAPKGVTAIKNNRFYRISSAKKIRDCIRIAALLREPVLRLAFNCKIPRDAEVT